MAATVQVALRQEALHARGIGALCCLGPGTQWVGRLFDGDQPWNR